MYISLFMNIFQAFNSLDSIVLHLIFFQPMALFEPTKDITLCGILGNDIEMFFALEKAIEIYYISLFEAVMYT